MKSLGWSELANEGWGLLPARSAFFPQYEKHGSASGEYLSLMASTGVIPYAEKGDIGNKAPEDMSKCKRVSKGDFVINSMNFGIGSFGVSNYDGICSPVYLVLKPNDQLFNTSFVSYIFQMKQFQQYAQSFGNGILAHRAAVGWDELKNIALPAPPLDEQRAIADFLDRELAQIDTLIAKQEQLQELLKTKRSIYISTKVFGQNPNVAICEMPELPSGWAQMKLKQVANIQASNVDKKIYEDGYPVTLCNYVDVYKNETIHAGIDFMQATATAAEIAKFSLHSGQVILTKDSESADDIGIAAFVPDDLPGVVCGYHLSMLTPYAFMDGQFLKYILDSKPAKSHFARYSNGLTRMALGHSALGALLVPVPPLNTQQELVLEMRSALKAIDTAISNGNTLISILRERRQSLISAAVTGKIDVRKVS